MNKRTRSATGYAAWRLIAEELRGDIAGGALAVGDRLPTEQELSERFGVNRHTVRQAVAALAADGLVESRRGSGTYVLGGGIHLHRLGVRTRMSLSLGDRAEASAVRVLDSAIEAPPADIADALRLRGDRAVRVEGMRTVGGRALVRGTHWFDAERFPDIAAVLRRSRSVTAALRSVGVDDYLRVSTTVSARHATADEAADLALEPGAVVLVARGLDALPDGTPLQLVVARFPAQRVALEIEHGGGLGLA
ncbi:MAG: phosphonate metabolism transcriptional regulator PhnF [Microbacteriaceae bacterium]|nr:phosphonate metabolism transcriptional regulator PhnF [Microbacteriaceae bacterium]